MTGRTGQRPYHDRCMVCQGQATKYAVTYNHNQLGHRMCGLVQSAILLTASCDDCAEKVGSYLFDERHSGCMGTLVDIERVDALLGVPVGTTP